MTNSAPLVQSVGLIALRSQRFPSSANLSVSFEYLWTSRCRATQIFNLSDDFPDSAAFEASDVFMDTEAAAWNLTGISSSNSLIASGALASDRLDWSGAFSFSDVVTLSDKFVVSLGISETEIFCESSSNGLFLSQEFWESATLEFSDDGKSSSKKNRKSAYIGAAVGAFLVIVVAIFATVAVVRRNRKNGSYSVKEMRDEFPWVESGGGFFEASTQMNIMTGNDHDGLWMTEGDEREFDLCADESFPCAG